jgi:hypothetical protein
LVVAVARVGLEGDALERLEDFEEVGDVGGPVDRDGTVGGLI